MAEDDSGLVTDKDVITALCDPATYPRQPSRVDMISTHTAHVFLAGDRVYKIKRPVRFPFLDLTALSARRADCEAEVELNRRLAKHVYLGVHALRRYGDGRVGFATDGPIVEWAVEMVRLPEQRMLQRIIDAVGLNRRNLEPAAALLCGFYAGLPPQRQDGQLYLDHLEIEQGVNRRILLKPKFGLNRAEEAVQLAEKLFVQTRPEIEARIAAGHIVEGHGDLRPEHVCLTDPPVVYDCLEFDRSMRILDPYDEINYLGIECAMRGAEWVRGFLFEKLDQRLQAAPSSELMTFYGTFRTVLHARLAIAHLLDKPPRSEEHWRDQAQHYLALALKEAGRI